MQSIDVCSAIDQHLDDPHVLVKTSNVQRGSKRSRKIDVDEMIPQQLVNSAIIAFSAVKVDDLWRIPLRILDDRIGADTKKCVDPAEEVVIAAVVQRSLSFFERECERGRRAKLSGQPRSLLPG